MKPRYRIAEQEFEVSPQKNNGQLSLLVDGEKLAVSLLGNQGELQTLAIGGKTHKVYVAQHGDDIFVHIDGQQWHVHAINPIEAAGGGAANSNAVVAPMPGVVVALSTAAGDEVTEGQVLLTIESMKLQTAVTAIRNGVIEEVLFDAGETFNKGDELVRFEPLSDEN